MTDRKSIPDLLYDALMCTIADSQWTAAVSIAIELRQWSTDPAWSRLGLTAAEGAAVDGIVETTAAQCDLKPGDPVWVKARMLERDNDRQFPYRVRFAGPNVSLWVPEASVKSRDELTIKAKPIPSEEREPLKVGDRVRILDRRFGVACEPGTLATVFQTDFEDPRQPYRVQDDGGTKWWVAHDQIERVEPERLKFGQWVQGLYEHKERVGIVVEDDKNRARCYCVFWRDIKTYDWCSRDALMVIYPQS